jgi:hypothetical protein
MTSVARYQPSLSTIATEGHTSVHEQAKSERIEVIT